MKHFGTGKCECPIGKCEVKDENTAGALFTEQKFKLCHFPSIRLNNPIITKIWPRASVWTNVPKFLNQKCEIEARYTFGENLVLPIKDYSTDSKEVGSMGKI